MAIPLNNDTYLDRIFSDEDVAGEPNILSLDPDANVRTTDQRYLQDAYNYYLSGGLDATAPVADTAQIPGAVDTLVTGDGGGGGTGITAAGVPTSIMPPFIETEPNVLTPPTLPGGAPISGPHGDYVITDPTTGDTYAPGDYTDVA